MTTTGKRTALVVRGGWDGHQPVEATDLVHPASSRQRVRRPGRGLAGGLRRRRLPGRRRPGHAVHDDEHDREGRLVGLRAAVAAGTGLAGWHGGIADSYRNTTDYLQLIGGQFACHPGKRSGRACRATRRTTTCRTRSTSCPRPPTTRSPRASPTSTWSPSSTGCCPTTTSTCWPPPPRRSGRGTRGTAPVDLAGDLDPPVGPGQDLRRHPRAPRRRPARTERPHHHRAGPAVGGPMSTARHARHRSAAARSAAQYLATFAAAAQPRPGRRRRSRPGPRRRPPPTSCPGARALSVDELLADPRSTWCST